MPPWWSSVPDSPSTTTPSSCGTSRRQSVGTDHGHGRAGRSVGASCAGRPFLEHRLRYGYGRHGQPPLDELVRQGSQHEAYDEIKRLLIFAGLFFLFMIAFVLIKFQIPVDDVFRWSPVVWLAGVIICGLLMNAFLQFRKFLQRRKQDRQSRELADQRQRLLHSLQLRASFPCLAPPASCGCPFHHHLFLSTVQLQNSSLPDFHNLPPPPPYNDHRRRVMLSPPAFAVIVPQPQHAERMLNKAPPKYTQSRSRTASEEDIAPPSYTEQETDTGANEVV